MLKIGTYIKPYGKIGAITNQGGERYYLMQSGITTSLMPADLIESMYKEQSKLSGGM